MSDVTKVDRDNFTEVVLRNRRSSEEVVMDVGDLMGVVLYVQRLEHALDRANAWSHYKHVE